MSSIEKGPKKIQSQMFLQESPSPMNKNSDDAHSLHNGHDMDQCPLNFGSVTVVKDQLKKDIGIKMIKRARQAVKQENANDEALQRDTEKKNTDEAPVPHGNKKVKKKKKSFGKQKRSATQVTAANPSQTVKSQMVLQRQRDSV